MRISELWLEADECLGKIKIICIKKPWPEEDVVIRTSKTIWINFTWVEEYIFIRNWKKLNTYNLIGGRDCYIRKLKKFRKSIIWLQKENVDGKFEKPE